MEEQLNDRDLIEQGGTGEESIALAMEVADRLFDDSEPGGEITYEPENDRTARAAVLRLEERFASLPHVVAEALEGAQSSGELLSSDRLQGIAEILQNADDANASEVRLVLRENALLVGHNGDPMRLRHILGLAMPWHSTKGGEADSFGRFGIGMSALRSLSRTIEAHCSPYHVRLWDPTLSPIEAMKLPGAFAGENWTVFRVPFHRAGVAQEELVDWLDRWGDGGLLFLRNVDEVGLRTPAGEAVKRLSVQRRAEGTVHVPDASLGATIHRQFVEAPGDLSWMVYTVEAASPAGLSRVRKAKEPTTPVGVALPLHETSSGEVYAGLPVIGTPLPVFANAQFDPLTSRRDLAPTEWNHALVPLVANVWAQAAIDLFHRSPADAWKAIPVGPWSDEPASSPLVGMLNRAILDSARCSVAERIAVEVSGQGWLKLGDLAVESRPLEGIVTPEETAVLLGKQATLPPEARDPAGRWRIVLEDWREAGASLAEPLSVDRALELLRDETRSVQSTIALAAAGLREGLDDRLGSLPGVVASDGRRLIPPSKDSAEVLAKEMSPLAEELGIVTAVHPAYLEDTGEARTIIKWLRKQGALLDGTDDRVVVRRLAAAGRSGRRLAEPLTDRQLDALRRAFELVDAAERAELGRHVGRAITLSAYEYRSGTRRQRRKTVSVPTNAYLPRSIDGGRDTFAFAAGNAPGIMWLDGHYGRTLRSSEGRAGIGARRLLTLLGVETAPRPRPHPGLEQRYHGQQSGLSASVDGGPAERSTALANQEATYTLSDWDCPAMTAAVAEIARIRRGSTRRLRAAALLAAVGRAWGRLGDFAEVDSAKDRYTWQSRGRTPAFWIWQAREIAWLDDESGTPRRPSELRIRTPGSEAIFGSDSPDFLHSDLRNSLTDRRNLQPAMSALGIFREPTRRELVARLQKLRDRVASDEAIRQDAAIIYRAFAESLGSPASQSDLSKGALRRAFEEGPGLIATKLGWMTPDKVFAGPAVFGNYMPFAPQVPGAEELWETLRLAEPSLAHCIAVLRRIARGRKGLSAEDETIKLETLRLLAERYPASGSREERRKLATLPLWTPQGWKRDRPVFAVDDESLVDALGNSLPLWKPGGELEQFRPLLEPLRIEVIESEDAEVVGIDDSFEDSEATGLFRMAVRQLQEDLVRNEPLTAQSLRGRWDDLSEFTVWSHPELTLAVRLPASAGGGTRHCPVHVRVDVDGRRVFVRNPQSDLPRAGRGGRALAAAFFDGGRRRVAQAWGAAWDRAGDGEMPVKLELAQQKAEREKEETGAAIEEKLEALRAGTGDRRRSSDSGRSSGLSSGEDRAGADEPERTPSPAYGTAMRVLVDHESLNVVEPDGRVVGDFKPSGGTPLRRGGGLVEPDPERPSRPRQAGRPRGYTDEQRETIGLELARKVLSGDGQYIVDLRAQRGVGADAMDEFERFYELKVSAGPEPNEVTLTEAEWKRARSSPDFFLVVVSGVEEGVEAKPRVRIIPNPLDQLEERVSGNVILSGVRRARSRTYEFALSDAVSDKGKPDPESK